MTRFDHVNNNLKLEELTFTPIRRHKHTQQRTTYYQTDCLDCELILRVRWEQKCLSTFSPRRPPKPEPKCCPFCGGTQIKTIRMTKKEYLQINRQWDIIDSTEQADKSDNDWLAWMANLT